MFGLQGIDGKLLLLIDDEFLQNTLKIQNVLKKRKLTKLIHNLQDHQKRIEKVIQNYSRFYFIHYLYTNTYRQLYRI
jgi:hypothetical protein